MKEVDYIELKDGTEYVVGKRFMVRTLNDNPKRTKYYWFVTGIFEPLDFNQYGYEVELERKNDGNPERRKLRIFAHNINTVAYPSVEIL